LCGSCCVPVPCCEPHRCSSQRPGFRNRARGVPENGLDSKRKKKAPKGDNATFHSVMRAWKEQQRNRLKLAYMSLHADGLFQQQLVERSEVPESLQQHERELRDVPVRFDHRMQPASAQRVLYQHPANATPNNIPLTSRANDLLASEAFQTDDGLSSTEFQQLWITSTDMARHEHAPCSALLDAHSDRLDGHDLKPVRETSVDSLSNSMSNSECARDATGKRKRGAEQTRLTHDAHRAVHLW
jgi:hypothetical protein